MAALANDGAARHLVPGLALPDIALPSTHGGAISLAGQRGLNVFYIYPWTGRPGLPDPPNWDDIPGAHGSTPEAAGFRDLHAQFHAVGAGVFGISGQDTGYQQEFSDRCKLPFALLSDAGGALRSALSLPTFETGGVLYLKRLTLIIRDGELVRLIYPVSDPAGHAADVLAMMQDAA
ncbi:MAG: peroxiredoxin [Hyphomicrobiaceae bacterium]|nr:peroxiredoxin [Hyphomicrobiaceae bacterium]